MVIRALLLYLLACHTQGMKHYIQKSEIGYQLWVVMYCYIGGYMWVTVN